MENQATNERVQCHCCPIQCRIPEGAMGACKRFTNTHGQLRRNRPLVMRNERVCEPDEAIRRPIVTAVGAGATYPCMRPAPLIVSELREDVEVVTVVTEAPLSYSGVRVKIDTNRYIGEAGEPVCVQGKPVGMVETEEYGSKMLSIGGATMFTSASGAIAARTVVALANGEAAELSTKEHTLRVQRGQPPVIDGREETRMRFGCGSATIGIFAPKMKQVADDVIVIDHHIIGLLSEHLAGEEVGMTYTGIRINGKRSSRGRYFGRHGNGIMGTEFEQAADVIAGVDMELAKPGMRVLITDTIGETRQMLRLNAQGSWDPIPLTAEAAALADDIQNNCETSTVSVLYIGGAGGSARGGVTKCPIQLTKAVHAEKAHLTIGGAPAYIMPGGGINFMVDTEKVIPNSFTWVPTPATVAPIEYTIRKEDYAAIGGHMDQIQDVRQLQNREREA